MHLHLIHLQNLCHFNQLIKGFIRIKKQRGQKEQRWINCRVERFIRRKKSKKNNQWHISGRKT